MQCNATRLGVFPVHLMTMVKCGAVKSTEPWQEETQMCELQPFLIGTNRDTVRIKFHLPTREIQFQTELCRKN